MDQVLRRDLVMMTMLLVIVGAAGQPTTSRSTVTLSECTAPIKGGTVHNARICSAPRNAGAGRGRGRGRGRDDARAGRGNPGGRGGRGNSRVRVQSLVKRGGGH